MAAVAAHHGGHLLLPAIQEVDVLVQGALALAPGVEGLVHHVEPQYVAGVEEAGGRRVVGAAHGVEAVLLQQAGLAVFAAPVAGRAQQAVVVVHAAALELDGLAVDQQALLGVDGHRAHARLHALLVQAAALAVQGLRPQGIEIGILRAPGPAALQAKGGRGQAAGGVRLGLDQGGLALQQGEAHPRAGLGDPGAGLQPGARPLQGQGIQPKAVRQ